MMDKHTKFSYSPDGHITVCERRIHNQVFRGVAKCHPADWDFESKLVGEHYAYMRSMIQEIASRRDAKKEELKALKHLYNILEQNPKVSRESIECYTIRRQIKVIEEEIEDLREHLGAIIEEIEEEYAGKDFGFYHVDIEAEKDLFNRFSLKGVPQVLFFNEGEFLGKFAGKKEEEEYIAKIEEIIG